MKIRVKEIIICMLLLTSSLVIVFPIEGLKVRGNTLYVGGRGIGNYSNIQDAIDDAEKEDTVYVYSGTYPSVLINKSISLIGENKYTTIIDANGQWAGITITAEGYFNSSLSWINVSGFTIRNATTWDASGLCITNAGYQIRNVSIYDNIITQNTNGFRNLDGLNCKFYKNIITNNNKIGIFLDCWFSTYITNNFITKNPTGISILASVPQIIEKNQIENNSQGIYLMSMELQHKIMYNNFIDNKNDTKIEWYQYQLFYILFNLPFFKTKWEGNYWDKWQKTDPKPIYYIFKVEIIFHLRYDNIIEIPLGTYQYKAFDYHPALEPYDVSIP